MNKRYIGKEKNLREKILFGGLVILALGGIYYLNSGKTETKECETFQGYYSLQEEGKELMIFDSETKEERKKSGREPKERIFGYPNELKLKIGENYKVTVKEYPLSDYSYAINAKECKKGINLK